MLQWLTNYLERRATLRSPVSAWLADSLGGPETDSGENVTPDTSLNLSVAYACVQVLVDAVAGLPLFTYRRLPRGKERAFDHDLYHILHDEFNEDMTSTIGIGAIMANAAVYGNGYAHIERGERGEVVGLTPLSGADVKPVRDDAARLWYEQTLKPGQPKRRWPARDVFHLPAITFDGLNGQSPIARARQTIGIGLAANKASAKSFKHGGMPRGILKHPHKMKDEDHKRLRESWQQTYGGADNQGKTVITEQGTEYQPISFSPGDSQWLETKRFTIEEICRFWKVPPHMVGHLDRATFSNIEHQAISFTVHTLRPYLVRFEQEARKKLFGKEDRQHFAEFKVDALLRGDSKTRAEVFAINRQWGRWSINDGREIENENPIDGGDTYLEPMNMRPAGEDPPEDDDIDTAAPAAPPLPPARADPLALADSYRPVIRDCFDRIVRIECDKLRRAYKRHADFGKWRADFYPSHEKFVADALRAPVTTWATMAADASSDNGHDMTDLPDRVATAYVTDSMHGINETFDMSGDRNLAFGHLLQNWEVERADLAAAIAITQLLKEFYDEPV